MESDKMVLSIGTNNSAAFAADPAYLSNRNMEASMQGLSTGKRINSASDDAAGVAIASRLSSVIRGTDQSIRNPMDARSLIDTAEGAHKEIENILQRMREVAYKRPTTLTTLWTEAIYKPKWTLYLLKSIVSREPPLGLVQN